MGIATGTFQQLLQEHRLRPFHGSLLTLGKQDIYLTIDDVRFWTRYYGVEPRLVAEPSLAAKADYAGHGYIDDRTLFAYLGASCESLDASPYEGCDYVFDLNEVQPPPDLRHRYDVVLDTGTLEHVFHLPNALQFCHSLLKEGGRMIHMSPTTNYVDHGFYMFSPTLFYDFYEANGWTIRQIRLIRHTQEHDTATYWSLDYSPDHFARLSFGGLGEGLYQTFVVVEKAPGATATRIPQQRAYREGSWRAASVSGGNSDESVALRIRERLAHVGPWITALQAANGGNLDVAIFGGGRHTAILLPLWRERNLPEPRWIVQSAPPDSSECCGLPVMTVDELARVRTPQLLVLSSQMFEGQMAQAVARTFPAVPMVRFWS